MPQTSNSPGIRRSSRRRRSPGEWWQGVFQPILTKTDRVTDDMFEPERLRSCNSLHGSPITPGDFSDIDLQTQSPEHDAIKTDIRTQRAFPNKHHGSIERRLCPQNLKGGSVMSHGLSPSAVKALQGVSEMASSYGQIHVKRESQPENGSVLPSRRLERNSSPCLVSQESLNSEGADKVNANFQPSPNLDVDNEIKISDTQPYETELCHVLTPMVHETCAIHHDTVMQDKRGQERVIQRLDRPDAIGRSTKDVRYIQEDSVEINPRSDDVTTGSSSFSDQKLRLSPTSIEPSNYKDTIPPGAPRKSIPTSRFRSPHIMPTKDVLCSSIPARIPCEVVRASSLLCARNRSNLSFRLVLALDYALIGQMTLKGHTATGCRRTLKGEETFVIAHGFAGDIICDFNDRRIVLRGGDYITMEQDITFEFYNASSVTCTVVIIQSRY